AVTLAGDTNVTVSGSGTVTFPTVAFAGQSLSLDATGTGGVAFPAASQSFTNLANNGAGTVSLSQPGGSINVSGTFTNAGTGNVALNSNTTIGGVFKVYGGTVTQPNPNTYQFSVNGGGLVVAPGVTVTANNLTLGGAANGAGETSAQIVLGNNASLIVNSTADIHIGDNNAAATNAIGTIISGGANSSVTLTTALGMEIGGGGAGTGQRANVL